MLGTEDKAEGVKELPQKGLSALIREVGLTGSVEDRLILVVMNFKETSCGSSLPCLSVQIQQQSR